MVARTRVARTRLSLEEDEAFKAAAEKAGVNSGEWLRSLIVANSTMDIRAEITLIRSRLEHLEAEVASMWSQEGRNEEDD